MARPKKTVPEKGPDMDFGMLKPEHKEALQTKAKELAEKEVQEELEDAFLLDAKEKAKHSEREKLGLLGKQEEMVTFTIDLPPNASQIRINREIYNHGQEYTRPRATYDFIRDIESKGWAQEELRKGDHENAFGLRNKRKAGGAR